MTRSNRKGSSGGTPFYYGVMSTNYGLVLAKTELQAPSGTTINYAFFGCSSSSCTDSSYGLRLYDGSSWSLWTASSTSSNANPPYLHTYNNYWSFKTCPSTC